MPKRYLAGYAAHKLHDFSLDFPLIDSKSPKSQPPRIVKWLHEQEICRTWLDIYSSGNLLYCYRLLLLLWPRASKNVIREEKRCRWKREGKWFWFHGDI